MRTITCKLGNMRKPVEWVVYPAGGPGGRGTLVIQSDHRICEFDPANGHGWLSKHVTSGAYFLHLQPFLGAVETTVRAEIIEAAKAAQPKSGDAIGPGVHIA